MRLGELSEHLRVAPRSATEVVDGLQALGLLQRDPDPQDRRATIVSLTSKGTDLGEKIRAAQLAEATQFFDVLSEAEQIQLAETLAKLAR